MKVRTKVDEVVTSVGLARLHIDQANTPIAALALGHGAGGGVEAMDLEALARSLPSFGITVIRVEQPWRVAGGKVATTAKALDTAWVEALSDCRSFTGVPTVVGGRSAGARVACRTVSLTGARGVLALAFPLHPPGRRDSMRDDELISAGEHVPVTAVQGDNDSFGTATELAERLPWLTVHAVPSADHSFRVPKRAPVTQAEVLAQCVVQPALQFVVSVARESGAV